MRIFGAIIIAFAVGVTATFFTLGATSKLPHSSTPLSKSQLIEEIKILVESTNENDDPEVQAARSVLLAAQGSLLVGNSRELMKTVVPFLRRQIEMLERQTPKI